MKPDIKADATSLPDRHEQVSEMESMLLSEQSPRRPGLVDLAVDLASASTGLRRSLPPGVAAALADLVRSMNCYYSNLIEGHDTHPVEIERALRSDFSADARKRVLQLEAKAHVAVQGLIDAGGLDGRAVTVRGIREIHRRFGEHMPPELLATEDPRTGQKVPVVPGELRRRDVAVGRHVAISPGAVPRFLERFERVYGSLGRAETILAAASAHHRLLWIHPFLDWNGRVARLVSHATLLSALDTGAIWSIARGLARREADYKALLVACDAPRRNDLDGRGPLGEESLADFTRFFLETCLDQVRFMEGLVQPDRLRERVLRWASDEVEAGRLPARSGQVMEAMLYRGELPRGDVAGTLALGDRQARRVVSALLERGVVVSPTSRAPLRLAFPAALAARWMPGLFPERAA